jgi:hypothetical protein
MPLLSGLLGKFPDYNAQVKGILQLLKVDLFSPALYRASVFKGGNMNAKEELQGQWIVHSLRRNDWVEPCFAKCAVKLQKAAGQPSSIGTQKNIVLLVLALKATGLAISLENAMVYLYPKMQALIGKVSASSWKNSIECAHAMLGGLPENQPSVSRRFPIATPEDKLLLLQHFPDSNEYSDEDSDESIGTAEALSSASPTCSSLSTVSSSSCFNSMGTAAARPSASSFALVTSSSWYSSSESGGSSGGDESMSEAGSDESEAESEAPSGGSGKSEAESEAPGCTVKTAVQTDHMITAYDFYGPCNPLHLLCLPESTWKKRIIAVFGNNEANILYNIRHASARNRESAKGYNRRQATPAADTHPTGSIRPHYATTTGTYNISCQGNNLYTTTGVSTAAATACDAVTEKSTESEVDESESATAALVELGGEIAAFVQQRKDEQQVRAAKRAALRALKRKQEADGNRAWHLLDPEYRNAFIRDGRKGVPALARRKLKSGSVAALGELYKVFLADPSLRVIHSIGGSELVGFMAGNMQEVRLVLAAFANDIDKGLAWVHALGGVRTVEYLVKEFDEVEERVLVLSRGDGGLEAVRALGGAHTVEYLVKEFTKVKKQMVVLSRGEGGLKAVHALGGANTVEYLVQKVPEVKQMVVVLLRGEGGLKAVRALGGAKTVKYLVKKVPEVNGRKRKHPASGFYGVTTNGNRWQAQINYDGKRHCLGTFGTKQEAALAYDREARQCGTDKALNYESIAAAEAAAVAAQVLEEAAAVGAAALPSGERLPSTMRV